jgi:D-sedoheptulose 7-phosphate isomerase
VRHNVHVTGWQYAPEHPDRPSWRRKPEIGMAILSGADLRHAVVVGDKPSDLEFAKNLGVSSILVRTGYGAESDEAIATRTLDSIADLTPGILNEMIPSSSEKKIETHFREAEETFRQFRSTSAESLCAGAAMISNAFREGRKLLLCGNGGSAADAQHIAAELVCRLSANRERKALPAIALTTDTSILTAHSNDYDFDTVFSRQIEALGNVGDVLLAISTSGNSGNVVQAAYTAREKGMQVLSFTGNPGNLAELSDVIVSIPGATTMRVQECHLVGYHVLCDLIETLLFD